MLRHEALVLSRGLFSENIPGERCFCEGGVLGGKIQRGGGGRLMRTQTHPPERLARVRRLDRARRRIRAVTGNLFRRNRVSSGRGTVYSGSGDSLGASGAFRTRCRRKRKPCPATARTHRWVRGFSRHGHCEGGVIGIRGNSGATNCGSRSAPRGVARRASELIAGPIMRTAARAHSCRGRRQAGIRIGVKLRGCLGRRCGGQASESPAHRLSAASDRPHRRRETLDRLRVLLPHTTANGQICRDHSMNGRGGRWLRAARPARWRKLTLMPQSATTALRLASASLT
jgi:hypothetical protein